MIALAWDKESRQLERHEVDVKRLSSYTSDKERWLCRARMYCPSNDYTLGREHCPCYTLHPFAVDCARPRRLSMHVTADSTRILSLLCSSGSYARESGWSQNMYRSTPTPPRAKRQVKAHVPAAGSTQLSRGRKDHRTPCVSRAPFCPPAYTPSQSRMLRVLIDRTYLFQLLAGHSEREEPGYMLRK